ncbi:MAG TPA: rhodanese-like domain-containing protein [Gammaproteobacteria bacterium]|nr:rhodanese-like domain-containing protein [Gammaproteobacteria bacterium]
MVPILNIASYKFTRLSGLPEWRDVLLKKANQLNLKGTILLSFEGININLAGFPENIDPFVEFLLKRENLSDLTFRKSYSDFQPFKHMQVKIKPEIITLKQPDIHPEQETAPHISPQEFKKWLDEARDITILDTRNQYEVEFGTFDHAENLHLEDFSEFPEAISRISRKKPVVMFCTGGIRCEKASSVMLKAGHSQVYQLQGGILNYFAEVGKDHYNGECFVFDQRIALDANLKPTGTQQCLVCQGPVAADSSCVKCEFN